MEVMGVGELALMVFSHLDPYTLQVFRCMCSFHRRWIDEIPELRRRALWCAPEMTQPGGTNGYGQIRKFQKNLELALKFPRLFYQPVATGGPWGSGELAIYQHPDNWYYRYLLVSRPPINRVVWIRHSVEKDFVAVLQFPEGLRFCHLWMMGEAIGSYARFYWPENYDAPLESRGRKRMRGFHSTYEDLLLHAGETGQLVVAGNSHRRKGIGDRTTPQNTFLPSEQAALIRFQARVVMEYEHPGVSPEN
ncbi:hypothetical protein F4779DRAFT_634946 [Xylariaceae sp. FL0662B]|nr:hypothetical protein F4779DRAFT_634946 [Xylariaceae sp. FL0662B]